MANFNIYNLSQWHWVADRVAEGYSMKDVADLLGVNPITVSRNLAKIGRRYMADELPPLDERRSEFLALGDDDTPEVRMVKTPLVGVDRFGGKVEYATLREAAAAMGVLDSQISNAMKYGYRCRGYLWIRVEDNAV